MKAAGGILKNSGFELLTYGVRSVSLLLTPFLIAKLASIELLGEFLTVQSLAMLVVVVATIGLPDLLTREIARNRGDGDVVASLLSQAATIVVVLSTVSSVVLVFASWALGYSSAASVAVGFASMAVAFEGLTLIVIAGFRGFEAMEWSTATMFVTELVSLFATLVAIIWFPTVVWLMVGFAAARLVGLLTGGLLYRLRFGQFRLAGRIDLGLLRRASPFAANDAVLVVQGRAAVLILASLAGPAAVGLLEILVSLTMRLNVISRSVNQALYPVLSRSFRRDDGSFWRYSSKSLHFLLIVGFLLTALLWISSSPLLSLYGLSSSTAVWGLRILALLIPLRFATNTMAVSLLASNRQVERAKALASAAAVSICVGLVLIPFIGLMGAVYSIVAMEVTQGIVLVRYSGPDVGRLLTARSLFAPAVGGVAILVASLAVSSGIWLTLALALVAYGGVIWLMDRSALQGAVAMLRQTT